MTVSHVYRFGEFRLDTAARELWREDELIELPRLTFDGLIFLVENRDRAVSRDELINAVWGRPYVEDIQVTHLVTRVRRALGDDSHEPRLIRTVFGFGYRWIADTEEQPVQASNGHDRSPAPLLTEHVPAAAGKSSWYRSKQVLVSATVAATLLVAVTGYLATRDRVGQPLPREPGEAVAVLPLEIDAPEDADFGWVRLGAMDLVAERLRDSGLPVPPSDSVISALHSVSEELDSDESQIALRNTLGAGVLVQGKASSVSGGWTVELIAATANGDRRRVSSDPAEIIPAVHQAANLLLAALGQAVPVDGAEDEALRELLQRSRAAMLALELDAAREILNQTPAALRGKPELVHELAWVEFRAGRLDEAEAISIGLLDDPAIAVHPRLHARALVIRGIVTAARTEDITVGEPYFDAAVVTLSEEPWAAELGTAMALRGRARTELHDFNAAVRDLGGARTLFEVGGDRLGLARVHNYFGNLELARKRPAEALAHFLVALEISDSFAHADWIRASLIALQRAQIQLLRWPEVLTTNERLWAMRERIQDPRRYHDIQISRANVLISMGRHREGEAILAELRASELGMPPFAIQYNEQAFAELAWQQGRTDEVLRATERVLEIWFASRTENYPEKPTYFALLHQRASIAIGQPIRTVDRWVGVSDLEEDPAHIVAEAEWAAHRGRHDEAERQFRQAASQAERWAVPESVVLVTEAYTRWLIDQGRVSEAIPLAGRVADWAEYDYTSALLQLGVLHAGGQREAWAMALERTRRLAGERRIPIELLEPPK